MSFGSYKTRVASLWSIQDMLTTGIIKLDAAYQRDIVWQTSKMSMLIDSLMKKFYIPPLLFAVRTDDNGDNVRVCIDGKQRLTSILRFTKNELPYLDDTSGTVEEIYFQPPCENDERNRPTDSSDRKYLSEDDRDEFNSTEIVMIEFKDLDEDQELEIFARVQMGVSITAAEKLLATNSPASKFCRELLTGHRSLESMLKSIKAVPFQYFSQLLYILLQDSDKYVASHPRLMEFLKDRDIALTDSLKRKVRRIIDMVDDICQDERGRETFLNIKNSQGVTKRDPIKNIEFLIFGVYISKAGHGIQLSDLVADLASLRLYLREEYGVGLYAGNPCWKAGAVWIKRTLESRNRRMAPVDRPSTSNSRRHGITLNDVGESSDPRHQRQRQYTPPLPQQESQQHQRTTIPASKRRRGSGNQTVITKQEDDEHVSDRARPLAKRGGKKTGSFGRA